MKRSRGVKFNITVPQKVYEIFSEVAQLRETSLSDTVRDFLLLHFDLLQKYLEDERAKHFVKKEVFDVGKPGKAEVLTP